MIKKKKTKVIIICAFLIFIVVFIGYHSYCHYMVSEFNKYVDEGNTEEILACIEKMPENKKEERINLVIYLWECGVDEWEYAGTKWERTILHDLAKRLEVNYLEILEP